MRPSLVYYDLFVTCTLGCYNRIYVFGPCVCELFVPWGSSENKVAYTVTGFLGKGLTSIVLGFLSVPVFAKFSEGVDGLRATIIFYSVVTILAGVLAWFGCQDETHSEDKANFRLADMAFVLKIPTVLAGRCWRSGMWSNLYRLWHGHAVSHADPAYGRISGGCRYSSAPMCYLRWGD